jgi:hypothetical protein
MKVKAKVCASEKKEDVGNYVTNFISFPRDNRRQEWANIEVLTSWGRIHMALFKGKVLITWYYRYR